jgi:hypothetical protein
MEEFFQSGEYGTTITASGNPPNWVSEKERLISLDIKSLLYNYFVI